MSDKSVTTQATAIRCRNSRESPHRPPSPPAVVVAGARLVTLLDRATQPLTVIIAPAGSGKTCALAHWAAQQDEVPRWFAAGSAPDRKDLVDLLTGPEAPGPVVVDDAHDLADTELAAVLDAATHHRSRIVLASRRELPLPVVALELSGRLSILRGDHLRLTDAEAVELIHALAPQAHEQDVEAAVVRAGGWAAAVVLAARTLSSVADRERASAALVASDQPVLDYLFQEVYSGLPASTRHVLLCTAHEQPVGEDAARVLSGDPSAAARLAQLAVEGVFVSRRDLPGGGVPQWVYHPLLVELLHRQVAPGTSDARLVAAAHRRAALHHATAEDAAEALRHAVASGDADLVVGLLVRLAPRLLAAGDGDVVRQAIAAVPARNRAGHRALLLVAALERRAHTDVEAVLRIIGELSPADADGADPLRPVSIDWADGAARTEGSLPAVLDADEADLRLWLTRTGYGEIGPAVEQALTSLRSQTSPARSPARLDPTRLAALSVDVAYAMLWSGEESVTQYAHLACGLSRATSSRSLRAAARAVLAVTELVAGRFQTAASIAASALDLLADAGPLPARVRAPEETCLHAVIGIAAWYALDTARARDQLELAEATLVPAVAPVGVELVRQLTARVLADEGHLTQARLTVASDAEALLPPAFLRAMLELVRGELAVAAGDTAATATHITALLAFGWESAADLLAAASGVRLERPESQAAPPAGRFSTPPWEACAAGATIHRLVHDLRTGAASDDDLRRRLRGVLRQCATQRLLRVFLPGAAEPGFLTLLSRQVHEDGDEGFAAEVLQALSRADPAARVDSSEQADPADLPATEPHHAPPPTSIGPAATTRAPALRALPTPPATAPAPVPQLTNREVDVLARLARGDSYLDIAEYLFITENTVKTHVASLYRKLNAGRRAEALRTAWALGLLAEVGAASPLAQERPG